MVYFITNAGDRGPEFTKSNQLASKRYLYKFLILLLILALILFAVAVSTVDWYLLTVTTTPAGLSTSSNDSAVAVTVTLLMRFGLYELCIFNESSNTEHCQNVNSLDVKNHHKPLEETKSFNVLVVVFASFALISGGSTWFCKSGVTKKVASYLSAGCILLATICGAFGFREAYKHFSQDIHISLGKILKEPWKLEKVTTGYSYTLAITGEVLLFLAFILYIGEFRLPKQRQVKNKTRHQIPQYRIMRRLSTKNTGGGALNTAGGRVRSSVFV